MNMNELKGDGNILSVDTVLKDFVTNSRVISASSFNVTKDIVISYTTTSEISFMGVSPELEEAAMAYYPALRDQLPETRSYLLKGAATVKDPNIRRKYIRYFSHQGMLELYRAGTREVSLEYEMQTKNGIYYAMTQLVLLEDFISHDLLAIFITRDISNLKQFKNIIGHLTGDLCDFVALMDLERNQVSFKAISAEMQELQPHWRLDAELDYHRLKRIMADSIVDINDSDSFLEATAPKKLVRKLSENPSYVVLYNMRLGEDETRRKQIMYMWLDASKQHILSMQTDVSETYRSEKRNEERVSRELHIKLGTDPVTGLSNKNSTNIQLGEFIDKEKPFVVSVFAMTNLIEINSTMGRNQGNMLLYRFARVIRKVFSDSGFIGRYTGSEIIYVSQSETKETLIEGILAVSDAIERYNSENAKCPIRFVHAETWSDDERTNDFDMVYSICSEILGQKVHTATGVEYSGGNISEQLHQMDMKYDKMRYKAEHDGLTGMYNKTTGLERIQQGLKAVPRGYHVMFVMDIDNFKTINDHFGHDAGDQVLMCFSQILKKSFRKTDILVRYGGDEFIAFITDVAGPALIEAFARQVLSETASLFREGGYILNEEKSPGVSIGVVWADRPVEGARMFKQADEALYKVKNSGKNKFEIMGLEQ